jgi:hypothetical protein
MPDHHLPIAPNAVIGLQLHHFADMAVTAALWLVRESMDATANKTAFDPDPIYRFRLADRLPEALVLHDLTEDQRHDMFVEGFRNLGNPGGMENAFELSLSHHKEMLWEAFRARWSRIVNR